MTLKQQAVGYFNIPHFPIAVEQAIDPNIRQCALAVAPHNSDKALIWSVSDQAKEEGIYKGMPISMAKKQCRRLKIIEPNPDLYNRVNRKLFQLFAKKLPLFEFERNGKIYFDYTGMEALYGPMEDFSFKLKNDVHQSFKLESSIGLGLNKLISKTAAKTITLERDLRLVKIGDEKKFLSPLPHIVLPAVQDLLKRNQRQCTNTLEELCLDLVEDIRLLHLDHLDIIFQKEAQRVFQMARGIDYRPICPPHQKNMLLEEIILNKPTNNLSFLHRYLEQLLDKIGHQLRSRQLFAGQLVLGLRYADYQYASKSQVLTTPFQYPQEVGDLLKSMFNKLYSRRVSLRYLSIECHHLGQYAQQLTLFQESDKSKQLIDTIDQIKQKLGANISLGGSFLK